MATKSRNNTYRRSVVESSYRYQVEADAIDYGFNHRQAEIARKCGDRRRFQERACRIAVILEKVPPGSLSTFEQVAREHGFNP